MRNFFLSASLASLRRIAFLLPLLFARCSRERSCDGLCSSVSPPIASIIAVNTPSAKVTFFKDDTACELCSHYVGSSSIYQRKSVSWNYHRLSAIRRNALHEGEYNMLSSEVYIVRTNISSNYHRESTIVHRQRALVQAFQRRKRRGVTQEFEVVHCFLSAVRE